MDGSGDIKACRLCLVMDCNLSSIDVQLENSIKNILGQNISYESGLPKFACDECTKFLGKFKTFRDKCLKAQTVLYNIIKNYSQITHTEIKKLNRKRWKLDKPLSPPATTASPFQVKVPCVTVKLEPMEFETKIEDQFEEEDEILLNANNPLELKTEKQRMRMTKKEIKQEITLTPRELDISEGFTRSLPVIENIKSESQDDAPAPRHCSDCCRGCGEDGNQECPSITLSRAIRNDMKSGKVKSDRYMQFRKTENARKKRFLEKMTPEQKDLKKKKDLEIYHRRKLQKELSEEERAKRRESWKKSSKKYRQKKIHSKMKGGGDGSIS